jgi:hypothetical protein
MTRRADMLAGQRQAFEFEWPLFPSHIAPLNQARIATESGW